MLLGLSELIYPRINNLSMLLIPIASLYLIISMNGELTIGTGWTLYPPLSTCQLSLSSYGCSLIIYSLLFSGLSS